MCSTSKLAPTTSIDLDVRMTQTCSTHEVLRQHFLDMVFTHGVITG